MAGLIKNDDALLGAFCDGDMAVVRAGIAPHPELQRELDSYLATFGDRCLEELKLETTTLGDDPLLLVRAVGPRGAWASGGRSRRAEHERRCAAGSTGGHSRRRRAARAGCVRQPAHPTRGLRLGSAPRASARS